MHHSEESGNRMGNILKILFPSSPSNIKARDKEEQEERKCSLAVETLTEDESFLRIKEAPSLIIPWWDASNPIPHSHRVECLTRDGQSIGGQGQNLLQSFFKMTVVKHKVQTSLIFSFSQVEIRGSHLDKNAQMVITTS